MPTDDLAAALSTERRLLDPAVRQDAEALSELLAEDFVEVGASGQRWTRAEIIAELASESGEPGAVTTSDWTVRELAPGLAMVGFVSTGGDRRVRRTSLYRLESGRWRVFFHQGTPEL